MQDLDEALLITAGITVIYQLIFYAIAATFKFDKVTDLAGGSNFVILSLFTFFHYAYKNTPNDRQIALTVITTFWGIRISAFLFYRVIRFKTDKRFDGTRENPLSFLVFWILQMMWVWTVSLPVIYVNTKSTSSSDDESLGWVDYLAFSLAGFALLLETFADNSKMMYKIQEGTKKWCTWGPWMYSRHPNYFGEILFWWSIFLSASQSFAKNTPNNASSGYFTIVGPVFITFLLLCLSGIPILEKTANSKFGKDTEYLQYRECTSPLIPLPHFIYRNLPLIVKRWLLFEWSMYEEGLTESGFSEALAPSASK